MVSTSPGVAPRVSRAGVVTCVVVEPAESTPSLGELAQEALVTQGADVVLPGGDVWVGAFRRVTDAVRAALTARSNLPRSRVALCTGETGTRGEFGAIAEKATRLASDADPGSTLFSKLSGVLAMDHLPRDHSLCERPAAGSSERCYELRAGVVLSA